MLVPTHPHLSTSQSMENKPSSIEITAGHGPRSEFTVLQSNNYNRDTRWWGNNSKINISYVRLNPAIYKAGIISSLKCFDTSSPNNHDKSYQAYAQILEVTDDKQSSDRTLRHAGNH